MGVMITFTGAVLFSTKAVLVKLAFRESDTDVITLLAIRMLFSLPFFLVAAWFATREKSESLTRRQWLSVIGLGVTGYYISSWFDFVGLQYISAGLERLILFLYPSFTALINYFIFHQVLNKRQRWAMLLTYVGIGIAYMGELQIDAGNENFFLGSFMVFICSITYAIYMAGSGRIIPKVGVTKFTAFAMLAATAGVFIHYLLANSTHEMQWSPGLWKFGLMVAILATVLPSFLISAGMKKIGANNVAIIGSIGPVSTILQAYLFLGEEIHRGQIIGTCLVIAGVLLIGWKSGDGKKYE